MSMHLKPVEFIHVIEKASLSAKASAHLRQCAQCRETLRDLRYSFRILRRNDEADGPLDAQFWDDFTQSVHRAIQQRPARTGIAWPARAASMVLVLSSALLFGLIARRDLLQHPAGGARPVSTRAASSTMGERVMSPDTMSGMIGFETLEAEQYLSMESRFYDRLHQDLSFLQIGPEAWADAESEWRPYLE